MHYDWIFLLGGLIIVAAGITFIKYRRPILRFLNGSRGAVFGRKVGDAFSSDPESGWQKFFPWIVLLFGVVVCILGFWGS